MFPSADGEELCSILGLFVGLIDGLALGLGLGICDGDGLELSDGPFDFINDGMAVGSITVFNKSLIA